MAWRGEAHLALVGRTHAGGAPPRAGVAAVRGLVARARLVRRRADGAADHADSNYRMARETLLAGGRRSRSPGPPLDDRAVRPTSGQRATTRRCEIWRRGRSGRRRPSTCCCSAWAPTRTRRRCSRAARCSLASPRRRRACRVVCGRRATCPRSNTWRLTITPATIRAARTVFVLVAGADKHAGATACARRARSDDAPDAPGDNGLLHDLPGRTSHGSSIAAALFEVASRTVP